MFSRFATTTILDLWKVRQDMFGPHARMVLWTSPGAASQAFPARTPYAATERRVWLGSVTLGTLPTAVCIPSKTLRFDGTAVPCWWRAPGEARAGERRSGGSKDSAWAARLAY